MFCTSYKSDTFRAAVVCSYISSGTKKKKKKKKNKKKNLVP